MENKNKSSFLLFFITFLTSFVLGFFFSIFLNNIGLSQGQYIKKDINFIDNINLDKYWKVYNIIKSEYYDINSLDNNKLLESSIYGLVLGLGDKHSNYLNSEENKNFMDSLSGDFEGIGAIVETHTMGVVIDRIIKGSPSKKHDLRAGDIIISANGVLLEGLSLYDAVNNIKGPAGTSVLLEVLRGDDLNKITKEVIREKIKIPSVDFEKIEDNIGYISINMFGEDTSLEFSKAITELKDTNGIILDLRDNGGGYLTSAVEILSEFIETGKPLVITKYKDDKYNEIYKSINVSGVYSGKIVILINENSASASEITAGALKEYQKAIVVGKKSYGKGSVQEPFELGDGSMLKLTVAKWFTPKGLNIDQDGIVPDIEISFLDEDYKNSYDRQKEEAKKILGTFIKTKALNLTIDSYKEQNK